ncbi:hypothetical protein [Neisseria sp. Ec49-e6-T10]|uniref:hypothetical protein n=1 Tax=Neisseria sp. Ec49-e6-T10 TaxID=3140744 RepID=UPI003EBECFC9
MKNNKIIECSFPRYEDGTHSRTLGMGCFNEDGTLDMAIGYTLLEFIEQQRPKADTEFEELLQQAEQGTYKPDDLRFGDWGINANEIWLSPPVAQKGCMAITNENTEYSIDPDSGGEPQQFTFNQYRTVLKFWRECQQMIEGKDLSTIEDFRREMPFPEQ